MTGLGKSNAAKVGVSVANKTFDKIYEDTQDQRDKHRGKGALARFDIYKGFRFKSRTDNILRLDRILDARGQKFTDAASVLKHSINLQYPGQMLNGKTLGDALVKSVIGECPDGECVSPEQMEELYTALHEHAGDLEAASVDVTAPSTVSISNIVQSESSIASGKEFLLMALNNDLNEHPEYKGRPKLVKARAKKILSGVDMRNGLSKLSFDQARNALEAGRPEVSAGYYMERLKTLLDTRDRVQTASTLFSKFNQTLRHVGGCLDKATQKDLSAVLNGRHKIMQNLMNLSFPEGISDPAQLEELAGRLEKNYCELSRIKNDIADFGESAGLNSLYFKTVKANLSYQISEALGLASTLRALAQDSVDDRKSARRFQNAGTQDKYIYDADAFDDAMEALTDREFSAPKTLWKAPTRQAKDTFRMVAIAYNNSLRETQALWDGYFADDEETPLDCVERELRNALSLSDAVLDSFDRAEAVRGKDNAYYEEAAKDKFNDALIQRHHLHQQLAYLLELEYPRAYGASLVTPRGSTVDENAFDAGGRESASHDADLNDVSFTDTDDYSRWSIVTEDSAKPNQGGAGMASQTSHLYDVHDNTDDGRLRTLNILNEGLLRPELEENQRGHGSHASQETAKK